MKLKINKRVKGHAVGAVVDVPVDADGTPLDKFWRRRLKDAKIDECVEVVKPSRTKAKENKQ